MNLVIVSIPGGGKGTLCSQLSNKGYIVITAGDLLRKEKNSGSDLGKSISELIDGGNLVPDSIITSLIESELEKYKITSRNDMYKATKHIDPKLNFVFDGYPRSLVQSRYLDSIIGIDLCLNLEVSNDIVINRILERGKSSGREDDSNIEIIEKRLENYYNDTFPVLKYYRNSKRLLVIDGSKSKEEVYKAVINNLRNFEYNV